MKLSEADKLVVALERLAIETARRIAERLALPKQLSSDKLEKLDTALGSADKVNAFLASMPDVPDADAVLTAFGGDPAKLGGLVNGPLDGDMTLLAALAADGCGRDPAKLVALADKFNADATAVTRLLDDCGMKAHPKAFAMLFGQGCEGDPDKLETFSTTFASDDNQKKLGAALEAGGLGMAPGALGALAKQDDGKVLRKLVQTFSSDDDHATLNKLLTDGGLDGRPPGRPGLFSDMLVTGLGNDPLILKNLSSAFDPGPPAPDDTGDLARMFRGLDGDDGEGGVRFAKVLARVPGRHPVPPPGPPPPPPPPTPAEMVKSFVDNCDKMGRGAGAPDPAGGASDRAALAATGRADPPPERIAGDLAPGLDAAAADAVLAATLTDADARADAAAAREAATLLGVRAEALGLAGVGAGPAEQTEITKASTKALNEATTALLAQKEGAPLAEISAMEDLVATVLADAALEPHDATQTAAIDAAKAGAKAIETALAQAAAAALAKAGPAAGAAARLADIQTVRAGASDAEKDTLKAMSDAALLAAAAAAGASTDTAAAAAASAQAVLDGFAQPDRADETKRRDDAAKAAELVAMALAKQVKAAAPPADTTLLARASEAAEHAMRAGREAVDETRTTEAFAAAKALADEIAAACKRGAAMSETAAAFASADGAAALNAASSCDQALAVLQARTVGGGADADRMKEIAQAAREGGLAIADAERLLAGDAGALKAAAQDAARRTAAAAKGGAPDDGEVDAAEANADKAASDARDAAIVAGDDLADYVANYDLSAGLVGFRTAIEDARDAAELALRLGPLAIEDGIRSSTITAAKAAMKHVGAASAKYAEHVLTLGTETLKDDQLAQSNAAGAALGAVRGPADPVGLAAASEATRAARDKINQTAGALLSDLILNDTDVTALRDAATKADAEARVPGADRLARVKALQAAATVERKICDKMVAGFTAAVAALTPVPANADPWPAVDPSSLIRDAVAACEAKATAGASWYEAAKAFKEAVRVYTAEYDAMAPLTADETTDRGNITALSGPADTEVTDAQTFQKQHRNSGGTDLRNLVNYSKNWTKWAHQKDPADNRTGRIKDGNGFVKAMSGEGERSGFTPNSREDLMRIGATLEFQPYAITAATPAIPAVALGDGEAAAVDMEHICGRHVRESYTYGAADGGPMPDDQIVGRMLQGKYEANMANGAPGAPVAEERRLINQGKLDKPNSLLPEGVTKANALAICEEVLEAVQAAAKLAGAASLLAHLQANGNWLSDDIGVAGPPACTVTYGINVYNGAPRLRMLYAADGDKVMMPDMIAMGKAIGL